MTNRQTFCSLSHRAKTSPERRTRFHSWTVRLDTNRVPRKTGFQMVNVEKCVVPVKSPRQLVFHPTTLTPNQIYMQFQKSNLINFTPASV